MNSERTPLVKGTKKATNSLLAGAVLAQSSAKSKTTTTTTTEGNNVTIENKTVVIDDDLKFAEMNKFQEQQSSWRVYRRACQFRFGYLSFLVMMSIVMFSFALLMEVFFSVFLPSAHVDPHYYLRSILLLAFLPLLVLVLSYCFEESTRLFTDSISNSEGSLPNFRLSLAVVIHYLRHREEMPEDLTSRSITYDPYADDTADDSTLSILQIENDTTKTSSASRWQKGIRAAKTAIIFGKTQYNGPPIDYSTFVIVDCICPVAFEIITILSFIIEFCVTLSINAAFYRYLRVGYFTMGGYLILWMICHFWSSRNQKMRELVANYHRTRRELEKKIDQIVHEETFKSFWLVEMGFRFTHQLKLVLSPFQCTSACCKKQKSEYVEITVTETITTDTDTNEQKKNVFSKFKIFRENVRSQNPWHKLTVNAKIAILIPLVVLCAVLSFVTFYGGWILMGFALILLADTFQTRFPQIFGKAFQHFITFFIVVSLLFFSSTFIIGTFVKGGDLQINPAQPNSAINGNAVTPVLIPNTLKWGELPKYPVCNLKFNSLDIIDFILLADAAYGSTTELQMNMLHNRFDFTSLSNWEYKDRNDEKTDFQTWMQIDFKDINTTVIAIRGTASVADALEDMHYWFGISIMQMFNVFVPFLNQLPRDFVIQMLSMHYLETIMPEPVYMKILRKVQNLQATSSNKLVVVGHSLGGAIAGIVGASQKIPAISFSGPGLQYTQGRFHVSEQDIRDYVVTVKPVSDIVPRVDVLLGMVQDIECRKNNPLACHGSSTHACELYMTCGDRKNRDWSQAKQCKEYMVLRK